MEWVSLKVIHLQNWDRGLVTYEDWSSPFSFAKSPSRTGTSTSCKLHWRCKNPDWFTYYLGRSIKKKKKNMNAEVKSRIANLITIHGLIKLIIKLARACLLGKKHVRLPEACQRFLEWPKKLTNMSCYWVKWNFKINESRREWVWSGLYHCVSLSFVGRLGIGSSVPLTLQHLSFPRPQAEVLLTSHWWLIYLVAGFCFSITIHSFFVLRAQ